MHHRPTSKSGLIPAKAFEHERHYLTELPGHLPAPYRGHERDTDQYGYISCDGNFYWVPGTERKNVKVLEYADRLNRKRGHSSFPFALVCLRGEGKTPVRAFPRFSSAIEYHQTAGR